MNDDPRLSYGAITTAALWLWVVMALMGAWTAWLVGRHEFAVMLGFTACASSAVAATAHIRCYAARVCRLIRVMGGLNSPDAEVRPFQPASR